MSPPHILLPSYTAAHRATADSTGQTARTVTAHLPDSGTLPSLSHWRSSDSSIPSSQSSPHNPPPPTTRSRHVNQARRTKVARCPEASLSCSGSTALALTVLDPTPPSNSSVPLLTQKKSNTAVPITAPPDNPALSVAPLWTSPSILEAWPSYDSIDDAAQCLVYRSVDDWLPASTFPLPLSPLQRSSIRPPVRILERNLNTVADLAFASNMAVPLRKSSLSAPRISPAYSGVHSNPLRGLFGFATLTQSIVRLSGELAASAVAGYQNHYGDPSTWKRGDEKHSFGWKWKAEWEEDMRALEMEEWIVDGNVL